MNRFFLESELPASGLVSLSSAESHHLFHVMRLQPGDSVELFDGNGFVGRGKVLDASPKKTVVAVEGVEKLVARSKVRFCFGIPKAAALEFIIRRLTEIGVEEFQPLYTENSRNEMKWNPERWNRLLIESAKQCQEPYVPALHLPVTLSDWMAKREDNRSLLFCDEENRNPSELSANSVGYDLLVGSEGGWSPSERTLLLEKGAISFGLGPNRLRTETAALVAATLLKSQVGELSL